MQEQEQPPAGDPVADRSSEHAEQDREVDDSQALQLVNVREDGHISYADLHSLEQYLDTSPDKAEALEVIVADISDFIEKEEAFKEWTSEVYDLIARKDYWAGGRHGSFKSWQAHHQQFSDTAKQGRAIRNKRKSAIDSLVANGVSGPRFEYMIRHSSRTFIDAVRKQVAMHGFSYPLICALANVRAFHRLRAGSRGSKGAHTQTCDLADLDGVTYRILSPSELASIKAKVGTHGFLQEACAEEEAVLDVDFDLATHSFVVGSSGFAQPEEYGKAHPKIVPAGSDEEDERPAKKVKVKRGQETFDVHRFTYITECTCPGEVPHALRAGLDRLAANCAYSVLATLIPDILQSCDKLCPRHCQLTLVKALGRGHLVHRTDRQSLQAEVRELLPKLEYCLETSNLKARFDSYKKSIGFSWDLVEATTIPDNNKDNNIANDRGTPRGTRSKRKKIAKQ
ncbi:hypothetical protein EV127DRAFT_183065 [Xylaria flabelliformis]|nr:hypothetical protein EV127DRAFT_183065 [Xylaria flabelliformis]